MRDRRGLLTLRARENFRISRLRVGPEIITAFAEIKKAAAETNQQTGELEPELARAIIRELKMKIGRSRFTVLASQFVQVRSGMPPASRSYPVRTTTENRT